jgi:hypothetical protein
MKAIGLDSFIKKIMNIVVGRVGGNPAGIFGFPRTEDDVLDNLRSSVAAFAHEYSKQKPDKELILKLSEEIEGYLRTLQLTSVLSAEEFEKLLSDLRVLTDYKLG